ncbi:uncharacterized protein LOC129570907 [Sitodiplosis mosellana]|uniref:uncharacterized protein LOC129570907 n=1 Tax=Sitodiplosis mosellana TaxID=263140 RepID=UPI002443AD77|nr:uncharacterized protein LOC129570907 [Sitodiplosis mosellana]
MLMIITKSATRPSDVTHKIKDIEDRINVDEIIEGELPDAIQDFVMANYDEVTVLANKLCWRFQPFPPENLLQVPDVKNIPGFSHIDPKSQKFQQGISLYREEMCSLTLDEFLEKSQEIKATPVYNICTNYMSIADSEKYIYRWLKYQFGTALERKQFITDVYNFITLKNKKKSILALIGDTSSGKTFFATALALLRGSYGTARQFAKDGERFAMESSVNQPVLFIDEAIITTKVVDELKERTGGDGGYQNRKGLPAVWVQTQPLILCSNSQLFDMTPSSTNAWSSRCYNYTFKTCDPTVVPECDVFNEITREYRLNPRALITMFQSVGKLENILA